MVTKIVVRLLDANGRLLGWTQVDAVAKGDGCLWSPGPVIVIADEAGSPSVVSLHWCDVNVESRLPVSGTVSVGQTLVVYDKAAPILVCGQVPGPLPPVTVRKPVGIAVPVGAIGIGPR